MNYLSGSAYPVTTASYNNKAAISTPSINISKEGYIYVYLSYTGESTVTASFDDLAIEHVAHVPEIISQNTYYPLGMRMQGVVNNTPFNNRTNQYTSNGGSELQNDLGGLPGYLATPLRQFDPAIGRFTGVDILAASTDMYNHYHYGNNNPVMFNDPTGAKPSPVLREVTGPSASEMANMGKLWAITHAGGGWSRMSNWANQYRSSGFGMSAESFINSALNSQYGGSWSNGGGYLFTSDNQAFGAGAAYNFQHNSWENTYYGSYEASVVGYVALKATGQLLSSGSVHTAIDIIRNRASGFTPAVACNEPNCTHVMLGPRRIRAQSGGGDRGSGWLDYVQTGLDAVGLVPGFGEVADGANALIYLGRGDYVNAGFSAGAMIPFVGWGATGAKFTNKAINYSKLADKAHGTAATFNKTTSIHTKIMFNDLTQGLPKQVMPTPKGPIIRADMGNGQFLQMRGFDRSGSDTTFDWIQDRSLMFEWKFNP